MEAYRTVPGIFNLSAVPELPRLVRTYEERLRRMKRRNPQYRRADACPTARGGKARDCTIPDCSHGTGTRRRQRREYRVRDILDWRRNLLSGAHVRVGPHRLRHSWRELVAAPLPKMTAATSATRAQARALMGLLVEHGPWNAWGVTQPHRPGPGADRATPYEVPKASEKCWRWWVRCARELARVLLHLDVLHSRAIPLHGTPVELPPREERPSLTRPSPREDRTGYRDHSAEGVAAILSRFPLGRAM